MLWVDASKNSHRPTMFEIREYFTPQAGYLIEKLNRRLVQSYGVKATPARYTKQNGWVIPYCLRGVAFFSLIIKDETCFSVNGIRICDENGLQDFFVDVDRRFHSGFSEKVQTMVNAGKERAKNKCLHEDVPDYKQEPLLQGSDPEKLNKFNWIPALSPAKLRKLYRSFANGALDQELLDDVGILFYLRCCQGIEEYDLISSDKLKCHHCGAILFKQEGLVLCTCGYQYTFEAYINSIKSHRMPGGNGFHIFKEYIEKWPRARTESEKMNLIDWMVHQCHISMSSGLPLRSVLKNLIDAPQKTAEKLVMELAYGNVQIEI